MEKPEGINAVATAPTNRKGHTPGPWFAVEGHTNQESGVGAWGSIEGGPERYALADIYADVEELESSAEGNASLIAAAPDLYEALQLIASRASGCQVQPHDPCSGEPTPEYEAVNEILALAREVLAKAEGL